jgi:hypothetical protein
VGLLSWANAAGSFQKQTKISAKDYLKLYSVRKERKEKEKLISA